MTYLEKLLDGASVEWRPLGEVCKVIRGERVTKKDLVKDGAYPVVSGGAGYMGFLDRYNREACTITVAQYGTAGILAWQSQRFWANDVCYSILPDNSQLNNKFLYYFLATKQAYIYTRVNREAYPPSLARKVLLEIEIPLPPLAVQEQIVAVLDKYTALETELEKELAAELEARKKQYRYYRNKLLRFGKEVEWRPLGEVADVSKLAGFEFTKYVKYSDIGTIIAIRGLNVKGHLDLSDVKYMDNSNFEKLSRSKLYSGDMLFTYVGTVGNVAIVDEDDRFYLAPNVCRIRFTNGNILPRFMFYYFQTSRFRREQMGFYMEKSTMQNLTMGNIRKFLIPLPPLAVQEQIVAVLDKFYTLVHSMSEGLPAEIALRQRQYRYYRHQLLDFPKPRQ